MASVGEMVTGPWDGERRLNAGWRYSSGAGHFAWDVGCPRGTDLYAVGDGVIVDCNDGEPDPAPVIASNIPSNWIVLKFEFPRDSKYAGKTGHAYYQHLTKGGVKVKKGQKVKKGDRIGLSGSSGNSSGPHLHLVILKPGYTMNAATRYNYTRDPGMVAWEPRTAWRATKYGIRYTVYVSKLRPGVDNSDSVKTLRRALIKRGFLVPKAGLSVDKPGNKYTDAVSKAVAKWQTKHGYKPDGVMGLDQAREFFKNNEHVKVVK